MEQQGKYQRKAEKELDLSTLVYGKVPPQAKDLEAGVLGAIMLVPDAFVTVSDILNPDCFYSPVHQKIYAAICDLARNSQPVDLLTVVEQLRKRNELEIVGGAYAVSVLTNSVVSSANVQTHSRLIFEKYLQREIIKVSARALNDAYEDSADAFQLLDEIANSINALSLVNQGADYKSLPDVYVKAIERIEKVMNSGETLTGVPSGIQQLDLLTQGFQPTDLIIIAARPSVGKSAVAGNIAMNAALHPVKPTPVGLFSLEMSAIQWVFRLISAQMEIDSSDITRGRLTEKEFEYLQNGLFKRMGNAPLFFDDTPGLKFSQLKNRARKMVLKEKVGLLIVDYLQLISGDKEKQMREQEISSISRGLKQLAKELQIPIIALSQLNRVADGVEPLLSHLRESGAIEQDADMVIMLYPPEETPDPNNQDPALKDALMCKVAKFRNGTTQPMALRFCKEIQKVFDEYEYHAYQQRKITGKTTHAEPPPGNFRPLKSQYLDLNEFDNNPIEDLV